VEKVLFRFEQVDGYGARIVGLQQSRLLVQSLVSFSCECPPFLIDVALILASSVARMSCRASAMAGFNETVAYSSVIRRSTHWDYLVNGVSGGSISSLRLPGIGRRR